MSQENFCTFMDKECTQTPKNPIKECRTVWSHLIGLTCNDPNDPRYLETGRNPGSHRLYHISPEKEAENQSESLIWHSCRQCRMRLEDMLGLWKK